MEGFHLDWKTVKKIDAHVHLAPEETLSWIGGVWKHAEREEYLRLMDKYNVEKAVLVPINEGATYNSDCSKTNRWLADMMNSSDGRFISFADVLPAGGYFYDTAPYFLEQAVKEYGLKGLKLHHLWQYLRHLRIVRKLPVTNDLWRVFSCPIIKNH